jgi:hypothetical protein
LNPLHPQPGLRSPRLLLVFLLSTLLLYKRHNGLLDICCEAGRLPSPYSLPVGLLSPSFALGFNRKLLLLGVESCYTSRSSSARIPFTCAEKMGPGSGIFARQGQQILPYG